MDDEFENSSSPVNEEKPETSAPAEEVNTAPEAQAPEAAAPEAPVYEDITSGSAEAPADSEPAPEAPAENTAAPAEDIPEVQAERINPNQGNNANPYSYGQPQQQAPNYQYNYQYAYNQNQPQYQAPDNNGPVSGESKNKKDGKKIFLAIIAVILVFALGVGTSTIINKKKGNSSVSDEEVSTTSDDTELVINDSGKTVKSSGEALTATEIAEKVRPSNVGIVIYSSSSSTSSAGEGSGIIMGEDSTNTYTYIITCAHVISDSGISVKVQTEDGKSYDAEIVGYDTRTDVGVVKIKATGFTAAEFGDSDALAIGDPVYAVGNPGGTEFFGSFTGGVVSAINRPISTEIGYTMKCIQHDAAINPGNSGGMLVNQYGQVVGINSSKITSTSYEGMNFSIPITQAKEIIDDLIQYSYVPNRPKLGITYYPVSASQQYYMVAQLKGLPAGTLIINSISSDSSLSGTKAQKYDMIIAVNGKELTTSDVLLEMIDNGKVGDKLTLTLCRVSSDYSVEQFDVEATLVEDKGEDSTTTTTSVNPFDYFYNYGGGSGSGSSNSGGYVY